MLSKKGVTRLQQGVFEIASINNMLLIHISVLSEGFHFRVRSESAFVYWSGYSLWIVL